MDEPPKNAGSAVAPLPEAPVAYESLLGQASKIRGVSLWRDAWRRLKKNWAAMISLGFLIALGLGAVLTPLLPLQSPQHQVLDIKRQFKPPTLAPAQLDLKLDNVLAADRKIAELRARFARSSGEERDELASDIQYYVREHPFSRLWNASGPVTRAMIRTRLAIFGRWCIPSICGTDELGRDVLSRICWGSRVSIMVGLVATFVSLVIGVAYGATAGYIGGWVDGAMMRVVDIMYSIPFIFIVIYVITILSEDTIKLMLIKYGINQIVIFYILIGAIYWLTMARVVRGQVISLKHEQFVDAARTIGAGTGRIVFRHLVPNVMGIVIVYLTLTIPSVMLFEAFLSFLGLGVQPPDVSWGQLVNEGIKVITPIETHWWLVLFPGLALAATLFALNFLGDGLRDALDPRMKNR